ncbi:MAG: CHAP domain-containing protein [Terracoccus sp.]
MNTTPLPGRHRTPGRHNTLGELRLLARESAQPALKSAAVVAAAGGLVAAFAQPASAAEKVNAPVAAVVGQAPTVVGPAASTIATTDTVQALGLGGMAASAAKTEAAEARPLVVEDLVVKNQRAAAKVAAARAARAKAAAAKAAAARAAAAKASAAKAAAESRAATASRASRTTSRATLTNSTAKAKSSRSSNSYAPSASTGVRSSGNWATRGQCTWGALSKWYQSTGFYPGGWTGNALVWGGGAARAGYTVSSTPRSRSILVMQPGVHGSSSAGHVAWVTSVSGNQVTVIEMNALAGAFNYNTRTLSNTGGMRYIYAP